MSTPEVSPAEPAPAPPALTLDDLHRYYLMEIKAAEERAVRLEAQAARERGRADALQAALAWLQGRVSGG